VFAHPLSGSVRALIFRKVFFLICTEVLDALILDGQHSLLSDPLCRPLVCRRRWHGA
jgi:hypothetical protein